MPFDCMQDIVLGVKLIYLTYFFLYIWANVFCAHIKILTLRGGRICVYDDDCADEYSLSDTEGMMWL